MTKFHGVVDSVDGGAVVVVVGGCAFDRQQLSI